MKKNCITSVKTNRTIKKLYSKIQEPISVVLLYDSTINRMKSYGPIALFNLKDNIKILDYHISFIHAHFENADIMICIGPESEKIIKYVQTKYYNTNIRIVENQIHNLTNACESLRLCLNNTSNSSVLIINALTLPKKIKPLQKSGVMLYISEENKRSEIGININEKNQVEHMSFCAKNSWLDMMWINNKNVLSIIKKILLQESYKKKMWFELINEMISRKINIDYTIIKDEIIKIDNPKTYSDQRGEEE
jgi:hypothetical protein